MLKYTYFVSTILILSACHPSKETVQELESWSEPVTEEVMMSEGDLGEMPYDEMAMMEEMVKGEF